MLVKCALNSENNLIYLIFYPDVITKTTVQDVVNCVHILRLRPQTLDVYPLQRQKVATDGERTTKSQEYILKSEDDRMGVPLRTRNLVSGLRYFSFNWTKTLTKSSRVDWTRWAQTSMKHLFHIGSMKFH